LEILAQEICQIPDRLKEGTKLHNSLIYITVPPNKWGSKKVFLKTVYPFGR